MNDVFDATGDYGLLKIKVGPAADDVLEIDAMKVHNQIADLSARLEGRPLTEFYDGVVDVMVGLGLPRVSHAKAFQFQAVVRQKLEEWQVFPPAASGATPASPGFTGSTPGG